MQTTTQTAIADSVLPPIAIHISFEMLLATIETLPQHQQWQLSNPWYKACSYFSRSKSNFSAIR
jgi:hypothetical protein